jgi:hypothetical protein
VCAVLISVTLSGRPLAHDRGSPTSRVSGSAEPSSVSGSAEPSSVSGSAEVQKGLAHPALDDAAEASLPEDVRRALKRAARTPTLPPVLLPERAGLLRSAEAIIGPSWHAVSMRSSDYSVYVHASARAIDLPGVRRPPVRIPSLNVPRISRTHDIVTAHFVAWGAAWDVDIECLGGVEHPLCGDDILVHELLRSLKRVDGAR